MDQDSNCSAQYSVDIYKKVQSWLSVFSKLPMTVQTDALTELITKCTHTQIHHLHSVITPYFQKDFINLLPKEISLKIMSYLSPDDLFNAAKVSQYWRKLAEDEPLWNSKCKEYSIKELAPPNFCCIQMWRSLGNNDFLNPNQNATYPLNTPKEENIFDIATDFSNSDEFSTCLQRSRSKAIYMRNRRITANWCTNKPTAQCDLRGHDEHVITCLLHRNDMIVTASDDQTIRIWAVATAKCLHVLSGHTGGVWALQMSDDDSFVVSGSTDRTVRIWNTSTGQQMHCLTGHTSTVRCMALNASTLVTGSRDCTLRIWSTNGGCCIRILFGHLAAVRCVQFDGEIIVSGAYDNNIIVWDASSGTQIHLLEGHTNRVYSLLLDRERGLVASGSLDATIKLWSVKTGECLQTLVGHQSLTSGMQFISGTNILVSANADCTIKLWDVSSGHCIHTLAGNDKHSSAVTSFQCLDNGMLVSGGDDGIVKLWDLNKGTFICDLLHFGAPGSGGCVWKVNATSTLLICAIGSRNQTEDTRLVLIDFDSPYP